MVSRRRPFHPPGSAAGFPLGNQTSQFFANVYLNEFDHFILRQVRPRAYARYVDDFVLFHEDKQFLNEARFHLESKLDQLRLRMHDGKTRVYRCADGVTFLGWRVFPDHRRLVRGNVVRFRRRLRHLQLAYAEDGMEWDEVEACLQAWNAHAAHGDTWRLREQVFDQHGFSRSAKD